MALSSACTHSILDYYGQSQFFLKTRMMKVFSSKDMRFWDDENKKEAIFCEWMCQLIVDCMGDTEASAMVRDSEEWR